MNGKREIKGKGIKKEREKDERRIARKKKEKARYNDAHNIPFELPFTPIALVHGLEKGIGKG